MTLPQFAPMLASQKPLISEEGFVHELKWDGYRALCYIDQDIRFVSRNARDMTSYFGHLFPALSGLLDKQVVLDGEIVSFNEEGKPQFSLLKNQCTAHPVYVVFDILHLRGENIYVRTWENRRDCLIQAVHESDGVKISPLLSGTHSELVRSITELKLEGIISKEQSSPYLSGQRSDYWRKTKPTHTIDCVIGGCFGNLQRIRSLLVGQFNRSGQLIYLGRVGSGLGNRDLAFLKEAAALLGITVNPFSEDIDPNEIIWLKPQLVAEIRFLEITSQGRIRHPVFLRFRWDKTPTDCKLEE